MRQWKTQTMYRIYILKVMLYHWYIYCKYIPLHYICILKMQPIKECRYRGFLNFWITKKKKFQNLVWRMYTGMKLKKTINAIRQKSINIFKKSNNLKLRFLLSNGHFLKKIQIQARQNSRWCIFFDKWGTETQRNEVVSGVGEGEGWIVNTGGWLSMSFAELHLG